MNKRLATWWALGLLLLLGAPGWAHSGHDHAEDEAPAAAPAPSEGLVTAFATSERYELLIKSEPLVAGQPQRVRLLLADDRTNRPIDKARIALEALGPATLKAEAVPTSEQGIYQATLALPQAGAYELIATVTEGAESDLLVIDTLTVAAPAGAAQKPRRPLAIALGGAALLGLGAAAFALRRRRAAVAALVTALSLPLMAPSVQAHSGHDHGEAEAELPRLSPGAPLVLAKESQFLLGITTAQVTRRAVAQQSTLLGRLEPPTQRIASLYAPQAGRIVQRADADLGSRVRKGQVLAVVEQTLSASEQIQLASDRLRLSSERAQLQAQIALAERDVAKARADRSRLARITDLVAGKDQLEAETLLRKAEDALRGLKAQRAQYDKLLPPEIGAARRFSVIAPFDGVLAEAAGTPGEYVEPSRLLFRLVDPRKLWLVADVYERDLSRVSGARSGTVTADALPGASFKATLLGMGSLLDPQSRTLKARFEVDNPNGRLKGGMLARIAVGVGGARQATAVPTASLSELGGKRVVFVRTAPEAFEVREVAPGARDGAWTAVASGVKPGEKVVVEGVYQLKSLAERGARR